MAEKNYDVLIVGTGAAGGVLAKQLAEGGLSVLILEGGGRLDPKADFRNDELFMGKLHGWPWPIEAPWAPITSYGLGGSMLHYAGWSVRFHPSDFRTRSRDGVGDDWPMEWKDLEPYYQKIEEIIGVAGTNENPFEPPKEPYPLPPHKLTRVAQVVRLGTQKLGLKLLSAPLAINSMPFDGRPPCSYCGFCTNGCMTGAKGESAVSYIPKALAKGAELRLQAFVIRVNLDNVGKASGVTYIDQRTGREAEARAKVVVLAANGIQNPRLLLHSTSNSFPQGLANSSGLVGKYLTTHLNPGASGVFERPVQPYKGTQVGGMIQDFYETDPKRGFARGYILNAFSFGPVGTATASGLWGGELKEYMRQYDHMAGLFTMGEDLPQEGNSVTLDPQQRDQFGVPFPRITYRPSENDLAMRRHVHQKAREILEAAGAKKVYLDRGQQFAIHFMGTTRMGKDPKSSVVNSFGQTHEVKNLFLAGSSIFVTAAPAPPTLTIQALSARTADYILSEGKKGSLG